MKIVLIALLVAVLGAGCWQHMRYGGVRRDLAQDRQAFLYGSDTFHLIGYLRSEAITDEGVLDALRALKDATETVEGLEWIYAGRVLVNSTPSEQLGDIEWTACFLLQLPSRAAYDKAAAGALGSALAVFPDAHIHGLERPAFANLLMHQGLGLLRIFDILTRAPSAFPFVQVEGAFEFPQAREITGRLLAGEKLNPDAVVVFNLSRPGDAEQQTSNSGYGRRMLGAMAEGGYGPLHFGSAVEVDGGGEFEDIVLVYYPGPRFFAEMATSTFFQGIIGGKQLGDNQSTITVPVLSRL